MTGAAHTSEPVQMTPIHPFSDRSDSDHDAGTPYLTCTEHGLRITSLLESADVPLGHRGLIARPRSADDVGFHFIHCNSTQSSASENRRAVRRHVTRVQHRRKRGASTSGGRLSRGTHTQASAVSGVSKPSQQHTPAHRLPMEALSDCPATSTLPPRHSSSPPPWTTLPDEASTELLYNLNEDDPVRWYSPAFVAFII